MNCSLYLDNSLNQTNPRPRTAPPAYPRSSSINDGSHSWYVQCTDSAGNLGSSAKRNFTSIPTPLQSP